MRFILVTVWILCAPLMAQGYQSFLSTGEILQKEDFQLLGYIESVFDEFDGINANLRFAKAFDEEFQGELEVGMGEFDVYLGAFVKWVPIPDYESQPAIGVRAGLSYIKVDDFNETNISLAPFVSKAFETQVGKVVPFAALPFGIGNNSGIPNQDDDTFFMSKLSLGAEWSSKEWEKDIRIIGELGVELSDSFNSFNIGANYTF